jgi:hypothetical protein
MLFSGGNSNQDRFSGGGGLGVMMGLGNLYHFPYLVPLAIPPIAAPGNPPNK